MRFRRTGLWNNPDFLNLWAGQTVSIFGTLIGLLALRFTAVLWLDAGAIELALLTLCETVPPFLIGPFAGVWVDRVARRPLLIGADIGRAIALITVPIAALFDILTVEQLYAVLIATSTLTLLFTIGYEAYLPSVVGPKNLVEGNARLSASTSVAEIGSFGVAGWLVQLLTAPGAVVLDALSFIWSAVFLARINTTETRAAAEPHAQPPNIRRELSEGFRAVAGNSILRALLVANMFTEAGVKMISVLFLLYLVDDAGFSAGLLGMIFAVGGITSLAGAWVAGRPDIYRRLGPAMVITAFARAAGTVFTPLATGPTALGVSSLAANQLITDPSWTFYEIHEVSLRQSISAEALRGRVAATMRFTGFAAAIVGTGIAALAGETIGARGGLFLAAGLMAISGVVILFSPVVKLQREPIVVDVSP
ncbi:MAG: MFS transporter [Dehalococcoidia bacterium]